MWRDGAALAKIYKTLKGSASLGHMKLVLPLQLTFVMVVVAAGVVAVVGGDVEEVQEVVGLEEEDLAEAQVEVDMEEAQVEVDLEEAQVEEVMEQAQVDLEGQGVVVAAPAPGH